MKREARRQTLLERARREGLSFQAQRSAALAAIADYGEDARLHRLEDCMRSAWISRLVLSGVSVIGALVACSSSGGGTGPAVPTPADPNATCDSYFDVLFTTPVTCAGLDVPTAILADEKSRFRTLCTQALSYPGEGITANTLRDCIAASGSQCRGTTGLAACLAQKGTLADGAACNSANQCLNGGCSTTTTVNDAGATSTTCGTCNKAVAVGGACSPAGVCLVGAECVNSLCVADASVDVGGSCISAISCKPNLSCNGGKCAALGAHNDKCVGSADCKDTLVCLNGACAAGIPLGGDCTKAPFGCAQGVCEGMTKKCTTLSLVKPGDACGFINNGVVGCAKGNCNLVPNTAAGTCPAVIPDGQACTPGDKTKTCDFLAACLNGTCTLGSTICK